MRIWKRAGGAGELDGAGDLGGTGEPGGAGDLGETGEPGGAGDLGGTGEPGGAGDLGETGEPGGAGDLGETGDLGGAGETWQQKLWNRTGIFLRAVRPLLLYLFLPPFVCSAAMYFSAYRDRPQEFLQWYGQFFRTMGLILIFIMLRRRCRKRGASIWDETTFYWKKADFRKIGLLLAAGAGLSLFVSAFLTVVPLPMFLMGPYRSMSYQVYGRIDTILAIPTVILMSPVVEEMIFRGFVLNRLLRDLRSQRTAVLITTFLFAVCHASPVWIVYAFFMGLVMAHVSIVEDNILYSTALHMGYNMVTLPVWLANSDPKLSALLFASPVLIVCYGIVGICGAVLCFRKYPLDLAVIRDYLPVFPADRG